MAREIICLTHHTWIEGMCNYGGDLACRDCTEQRIKQLEEVKRTFINFLGRLIDGEKFTQEKLNEYLNIILDIKALEGK